MATTLHTPVRFARTRIDAGVRLAPLALGRAGDLLLASAAALVALPWLVFARRLTTDELNGLFGDGWPDVAAAS